MLMLREIIDHHGVPLALYSDRHGIFQRSSKQPETLEEQLRGRRDLTQFARALEELDIRLILAHTPQAKGRIERVWGTFQDRLVSELRLAGATTIEQANRVLADFLPRFNRQFAVVPAQLNSAYRQLPPDLSLDSVLCFKYRRTVANDDTVRFNGAAIQILPNDRRSSYARATVEVQERLDGTILVVHQGRTGSRAGPTRHPDPQSPQPDGAPTACSLSTAQRPAPQAPSFPLAALSDGTERKAPRGPHTPPPPQQRPTTQGDRHPTTPGEDDY
jgi:hypothetical protein